MADFRLPLALLIMGFTFTVTQVMVIRELLVLFTGNELSIAIILANWLLLEAAGSYFIGRKVERWRLREGGYAFFQLLLSGLLPLTIYAIRGLKDFMGLVPGEGASLLQILSWTILVLAPLGIVDGILFALGCSLHSKWRGEGAVSIGRVYLLEGIGAGSGGVLYTFVFIAFLGSFQVAAILGLANLASGFLLVSGPGRRKGWRWTVWGLWGYMVTVNLLLLAPPASRVVEKASMNRLWRGFEVLDSRWSSYGNVTVARREGQLTFFSNGIPACNVPMPDVAFAEELIHYPLLLVPSPRKVLVIGGGLGGVLEEILKHPVEKAHYAEINPLIVRLVEEHGTELTRRELEDPRVRVHLLDGRRYLKTAQETFDAVILNLPAPSTLELNRFFTVEFFQEVFRLLDKEGILTLAVPGSETYLGPEARDLNLAILRSLRETFSSVAVIPGEMNLILASPSGHLRDLTAEHLTRSLRENKIPTRFATPAQIQRKLEPRRLNGLEEALARGGEVRFNRDRNPAGIYYGIAYWNAQFHPSFQKAWRLAGEIRLSHFGLALLALVGAVAAFRKRSRRRGGKDLVRISLIWVVTTTGFFGTAMSILLILSFQTLYGHAYDWIGLLVAAFMTGLALGSWAMNRALEKISNRTLTLIGLEGFILLHVLLAAFSLHFFYSPQPAQLSLGAVRAGFLLMSLISGFWVGLEFPLAGLIFSGHDEGVSRTAGLLYASDLCGAWAGALFVGVIFLPVLGVLQTCAAVLLLKLAGLALLILADRGLGMTD